VGKRGGTRGERSKRLREDGVVREGRKGVGLRGEEEGARCRRERDSKEEEGGNGVRATREEFTVGGDSIEW
jgi:hypothetical protein